MEQNSASSFKTIALAALLVATMPACSLSPEMAKSFNESIGKTIGVKLQVDPTPPKPAPVKKADAEEEEPSPDNRAMNAEFIREMMRVTVLRDLRSHEEFNGLMNVLDQGGHYEALYNGVIYAAEYREREKGIAPVAALKAYAEIMAQITLDQKYDPLKIQRPEGAEPTPAGTDIAPPQPSEPERIALLNDLEREAITKSPFYMKRRIGEEVLKTIDLKKEYREKLATWYARFTVFLNKRGVDFAVPLRNKTDEYFHYKWALDAPEDRLKWECLNRIHRVINAGAGMREPAPSPAPAAAPVANANPGAAAPATAPPAAQPQPK
ncbi:MAG: hypothetical protein HY075_03930 [Deltaproteobacteria bacterium]|nr:hypothetical protein [Deltaproteobacteria bacterium]